MICSGMKTYKYGNFFEDFILFGPHLIQIEFSIRTANQIER
jgi:hypothetical protein